MSHAERHRHILFGARLGLVWESYDITGLLVLLGKLQISLSVEKKFRLTSRAKILSIAFELAEYSLQHQLPNFEEVWFSLHSVVMTQLSPDF
jgi:hypothetical protein